MDYDVVVAGGGPAGLQFAREIGRRSDYDAVVLERNDDLSDNDKSTGGTFHQVIDGFDVSEEVVMAATPGVIFEGPSTSSHLQIPNYVLDFPEFLEFLGTDAEDAGVDVETGTRVVEPVLTGGRVTGVRCRRDGGEVVYDADLVVDATGPAGTLTAQLGMWDPDRAQRGIGKEYEVVGDFEADAMLFAFDHEYAPGGYAWVFPAGDRAFKVGVCWIDDFYERHSQPGDGSIDDYLQRWIDGDDRWNVEEVRAVHAGQAISDNSINERVRDGILAVGDSVSSINPLFGEGIRPAMESARMAADAAISALDRDDTSRAALLDYEDAWNHRKGPNWRRQRIVGELLYDFDAAQQDRFVETAGDLSGPQLRRLQEYDLTIRDLLELYPFALRDVPKVPRLLRHLR